LALAIRILISDNGIVFFGMVILFLG